MLRYAITDLTALPAAKGPSPAEARRLHWLQDLRRWSAEGTDFVQLREKTLDAGELFTLADQGTRLLHQLASKFPAHAANRPKLLINSRPDIAAAARAHGVHLTSRPGELTPTQIRTIFQAAGLPHCTVSISCHTPEQAAAARNNGADLILFGPVFEKNVSGERIAEGTGLTHLRAAVLAAGFVPVLALGGITAANTPVCLNAGAAGVAAIRLFQTTSSLLDEGVEP